MTEETTTTTKIEEAFEEAWLGDDPEVCSAEASARKAFAAGARAFSTMPLCEHGVAVWGIECCEACSQGTEDAVKELEAKKEEAVVAQDFELVASLRDKIEKLKANGPGEFPGYNRPFEAELPEGMTAGHLQDLQVEHETMRRTLLQLLVKVGALDQDAITAPWDAVNVVHFSGLWLADGLPFAKSKEGLAQAMHKMLLRVEKLENVSGVLKTKIDNLEREEKK
jgi:hypothetical protein